MKGQRLGLSFPQRIDSAQLISQGTQGGVVLPATLEWWKTNEGSGTTLATQSGSGDTLTFSGTWTTPTGFSIAVPTFNGTTQSAPGTNTTNTNFSGATPYSVSAWIFATALNAVNGAIIGNIDSTGLLGWEVSLDSTGKPTFSIIQAFPGSFLSASSPVVSLNTIHHLVFTYDGSKSTAGVKIYLDGVSQTVSSNSNTFTTNAQNAQPVTLGNRTATSDFFAGSLADIRIFSSILSQAQVTLLKNGGVV